MNTFGSRLYDARVSRGLSMQVLADRIGCSVRSVFAWEHDKFKPRNVNTYYQLAEVLSVSMDYLLFGELTLQKIHTRLEKVESDVGKLQQTIAAQKK